MLKFRNRKRGKVEDAEKSVKSEVEGETEEGKSVQRKRVRNQSKEIKLSIKSMSKSAPGKTCSAFPNTRSAYIRFELESLAVI